MLWVSGRTEITDRLVQHHKVRFARLQQLAIQADGHELIDFVTRIVGQLSAYLHMAAGDQQTRGLPLAYVLTAGNQAQTGLADMGRALLADDRVTALGLHIEGVGDLRAFEALVRSWANVRECHMLMGEDDFILKVMAPSVDELNAFIISHLTSAPNVKNVKTAICIRRSDRKPSVPVPMA